MTDLVRHIQVHVPFTMLQEGYLELFIRHELNPEIGFDARALDEFSAADYRAAADAFRSRQRTVTLHAPFIDLSAGSTDPAVRAVTRRRFEELLHLVPLFRPVTVVAHAGYDWQRYEYFREAWLENSVAFWSWAAEALAREGARLMLENVYEHRPQEMLELFAQLAPQNVGLCLDAGHLTAFGRAPLGEWLEVLGAVIGQLHLHDSGGEKDDHLPVGGGVIDFRHLLTFLKSRRPAPPVVTLEIHRAEDLWQSLEHLERIWPW
jgi:sugar phosphate isomerase/epimerase